MRLNTKQVEALAKKIISAFKEENVNPIIEYNNSIKSSREYEEFISKNKDCQVIEKYRGDNYVIDVDINAIQKHIRSKAFESKLKEVPSTPYIDDVINVINLATIDKKDVESIISAVKSNFW